jgi:hypothetical protein
MHEEFGFVYRKGRKERIKRRFGYGMSLAKALRRKGFRKTIFFELGAFAPSRENYPIPL